jgi:cytochrome c biogenesis protein CcmG/thiol:disulfide interchange protein DsbE
MSGRSPEKKPSSGRNPIIIFIGFLLLGAALALLLFGRNLFAGTGGEEPATVGEAEVTVLDQVSELPSNNSNTDQPQPARESGNGLSVGDRAYDFTLDDLAGDPVSLSDFRGQPIIVNFWATWCAPCRIEMPELQEAYEKYQDDGLVILALDQDEPADVAHAFFYDEMDLTFTPILDEGSEIATSYGSFGVLPSSIFIDSDGLVRAIHRGPVTLGQIEGYLADMLVDAT